MKNKNYHTFRTVPNSKGKNHVDRGEIDTTKMYKTIYEDFEDAKGKIIYCTLSMAKCNFIKACNM